MPNVDPGRTVTFVAFDLHAELAAGLRDAPGAWRFIKRFAARYATPVGDDDGVGELRLAAAEARLGFAIPGALRDAYALIGERDDLTRQQDQLLTPEEIRVDDTGQVLIFRIECQHVAEWGIPLRDPPGEAGMRDGRVRDLPAVAEPDPPVVFRLPHAGREERAWQRMGVGPGFVGRRHDRGTPGVARRLADGRHSLTRSFVRRAARPFSSTR